MPTRMSPGCSQAQRCSLGAILNCPTWGEEDRAFKGLKSSLNFQACFHAASDEGGEYHNIML